MLKEKIEMLKNPYKIGKIVIDKYSSRKAKIGNIIDTNGGKIAILKPLDNPEETILTNANYLGKNWVIEEQKIKIKKIGSK